MAEIRNTFVKSKMNKDLDDRLLSRGEYRNAENVQISRSEGEDVGALENVLGNNLITNWGLNNVDNLEVIGYTTDPTNDRAFFIATNYTDVSENELNNSAPYGAACYILMFDNKATSAANKFKILVEGRFLNFSKTHPVFGINLIEDLLFWTDNRNQPRKINVTKAIADNTYYTNEDQISVAKYYPYKAPQLWEEVCIDNITTTGSSTTFVTTSDTSHLRAGMALAGQANCYIKFVRTTSPYSFTLTRSTNLNNATTACFIETSSKNVTEEYLTPSIFSRVLDDNFTNTMVPISDPTSDVLINMQIACPSTGVVRKITNVQSTTSGLEITFSPSANTVSDFPDGALVAIAWPNPNYVSSWPGNEDYLSDKFVRFAYRFKFDDGEYSVISPFTQPAFIPKNNGYIPTEVPLGLPFVDNEGGESIPTFDPLNAIATSTILAFFENRVQQVKIKIPLPCAQNALEDKLKVSEIQLLYKESDGLAIQILEEVKAVDLDPTDTSEYYIYNYQSRRPFRVLPEKETLRVFDKVPIRALSQSVVGNRVVYGNFIDKHSPPVNLTYSVAVSEKYQAEPADDLRVGTTSNYSSNCSMAYPIHTVKQNRTYQVGVVLSDKYGRQSDVILSSITDFQQSTDGGTNVFDGSTIYAPYSKGRNITGQGQIKPEAWLGNSLKVLFSGGGIPETSTNEGYPGLYKSGLYSATVSSEVDGDNEIEVNSVDSNISVGDIVTGENARGEPFVVSITAIEPSTPSITVSSNLDISANEVLTIHGKENKLGWYSYKIVVKQLAEEYYNAFLGGFSTVLENAKIQDSGENFPFSFATTLLSDNVNKIPADLGAVAPEQNQFGTSDTQMSVLVGGTNDRQYPQQFYFGTSKIGISAYGKVLDLGLSNSTTNPKTDGLFLSGSNPPSIITQGSQNETFGVTQPDPGQIPVPDAVDPIFSVVEVKPPVSRLEIYWETSTSGLVSELNHQIATGGNVSDVDPAPVPDPETPVEE